MGPTLFLTSINDLANNMGHLCYLFVVGAKAAGIYPEEGVETVKVRSRKRYLPLNLAKCQRLNSGGVQRGTEIAGGFPCMEPRWNYNGRV